MCKYQERNRRRAARRRKIATSGVFPRRALAGGRRVTTVGGILACGAYAGLAYGAGLDVSLMRAIAVILLTLAWCFHAALDVNKERVS